MDVGNANMATVVLAGPVILQDLWLPNWAGGFAGAQAFGPHASKAEVLFWRRDYSCVCGRRGLLQVSQGDKGWQCCADDAFVVAKALSRKL